ncbi:MAG: hypothetical protein ACRDY7_10385 [Acidimicrobiia bacterium]
MPIITDDDRPHRPGPEPLWAETWQFDFAADAPGAGSPPGGFVALHCWPNLGTAWWWTHLLTASGLVALRDHEVAMPRTGLEVRADGLWGDLVCETPLEHWSIGLEAFAVRYDDPVDAWGDEWGERIPVGLDLEWETTGAPQPGPVPGPPGEPEGGWCQAGTVHGEILVGPSDRFAFNGTSVRSRRWGVADWWTAPERSWPEPLPDGSEVAGCAPLLIVGPGGRRSRLLRELRRHPGGDYQWSERLTDEPRRRG